MRILLLGIDPEILPPNCKPTQDPAEADAVLCSPALIEGCPDDIPVYVLKENSMKDFFARQKRPDAVFVTREELKNVLYEEPMVEEPKLSKNLMIASYANKGGVGKTTAILSLAYALNEKGCKVVLCDLDFGAPDLAGFFKTEPRYGLEKLGTVPVKEMLVRIKQDMYLLPGVSGTTEPDARELLETLKELRNTHDAVLLDTPPAPWEKPVLHSVFPECDLVYAVVDQSKFSMQETAKYVPTLLAMGVSPNRIRLVVNRYNPKLTSIKEIQKAFVSGFRKEVKYTPKVSVVIPEGWEDHVKALAKGRVAVGSEWEEEVDNLLSDKPLERGKRRWIFSLF